MRLALLIVPLLLAACASPSYRTPVVSSWSVSRWCDGAYDRRRGTNFGPCMTHVGPGVGDIQSPGEGTAAASDSSGPSK